MVLLQQRRLDHADLEWYRGPEPEPAQVRHAGLAAPAGHPHLLGHVRAACKHSLHLLCPLPCPKLHSAVQITLHDHLVCARCTASIKTKLTDNCNTWYNPIFRNLLGVCAVCFQEGDSPVVSTSDEPLVTRFAAQAPTMTPFSLEWGNDGISVGMRAIANNNYVFYIEVDDVDGQAEHVTLTGTSSNTSFVRTVAATSSGSNRTVVLGLAAECGISNLTFLVVDRLGLNSTQTFPFEVQHDVNFSVDRADLLLSPLSPSDIARGVRTPASLCHAPWLPSSQSLVCYPALYSHTHHTVSRSGARGCGPGSSVPRPTGTQTWALSRARGGPRTRVRGWRIPTPTTKGCLRPSAHCGGSPTSGSSSSPGLTDAAAATVRARRPFTGL